MNLLPFPEHGPVIPVIVLDDLADAVPLARTLVDAGVRVLEITLRTPVALRAIAAISRAVPDAVVGAGTVRSADDVRVAADAGCRFVVSPGYTAAIGAAAAARGLALLPGVATPTEVLNASGDGYRYLKFFPAAASGGLSVLKAWAGPFGDVLFCPTGGIDAASAPAYLALPNVRAVGGSWLTPGDAVRDKEWARIGELARAARALGRH